MTDLFALSKILFLFGYMFYLSRKHHQPEQEVSYCQKCDNIRWYGNYYVDNCKGHE